MSTSQLQNSDSSSSECDLEKLMWEFTNDPLEAEIEAELEAENEAEIEAEAEMDLVGNSH